MKENKKNVFDLIFRIGLIILIIILFVHNCSLRKQQKGKDRETTGNVQIIEILCDDDSCVDNTGKKSQIPNTDDGDGNTDDNGGNVISDDGLIIRDRDVKWSGNTKIDIFNNSMYTVEDKIAPEDSNTYQFIVKNSTKYNLKYMIEFIETNDYNINMKFKLKRNDTYLVDHYVSASELNTTELLLNASNSDTFYLEWKWISSDNDTEIGSNPESFYGLKIDIKADSNNG